MKPRDVSISNLIARHTGISPVVNRPVSIILVVAIFI